MLGETVGAFVAGVVVGWVGRGMSQEPREEMVRSVATGMRVVASTRRWITERVEWVEDVVAEGQARYESSLAEETAAPRAPAEESATP